ncbi:hypothetical protein LIER_29910 [Lithospermum erythrorhizon]|uniref:Uncharacterized protein n=1 Tax=Lithospermum erythrorhizon TaxID=34254 RepID=A0AAV3RRP4_LITER
MSSSLTYSILHLTPSTKSTTTLLRRLPSSRVGHCRLRCNSELTSNIAPLTSAAYGVFLLGGGLFAYSKSESKGSLFGGVTGAVLMSIAYRLMLVPETKHIGDALAFGSALLFASVFGIRLASTRKIMPGGVLLGLSVGAMAVFYSAYLQDKL